MCKLCDKVDFLIDTMESFITVEEWTAVAKQAMTESGVDIKDYIIDDKNTWMNVITRICARWGYRQKIPPVILINSITRMIVDEYNHADEEHEQRKQKLKELES